MVSAVDALRDYKWIQTTLLVLAVLAVVVLVAIELLDRADEKDASKVLSRGLAITSNELEALLLAPNAARKNKFDQLCVVAITAIAQLDNAIGTQAQLFWVHKHGDHQHLVSIYASNGNKDKSRNHFSSVGDEADRIVWNEARAGRTVFHRNLTRFRLQPMPTGFTRSDRNRRYKAFITAPIIVDRELLGLLTINSEAPYSLSLRDKYLVEVFAQQIALGAAASKASRKPREYETIKVEPKKGCYS